MQPDKAAVDGCGETPGEKHMYHGIINVYKESGYTSHDAVAKLRGILGQKKIGHTGTLDPAAVGVLPICLGSGTKLCDMLTDKNKEYRATLLLGQETDTQDTTGTVLAGREVTVTEEEVSRVILSFAGEYDQIPPMYSAIKVDGKKLYQLAREGKEVERKARRVRIDEIEIEKLELPYVTMRVRCSKGTYIRTLCYDIGRRLECGGTMAALTRTQVGEFRIEEALRLDEIERLRKEGGLEEKIIPVDAVFQAYRRVTVAEQFQKLADNGNAFYGNMTKEADGRTPGEQVRVYGENGRFYGIYEFREKENRFCPVKMFMEN